MAESLTARVSRTEKNLADITEKQSQLDDLVKVLFKAQIETEKRFQQTDERIGKLAVVYKIADRIRDKCWLLRRLEGNGVYDLG